MKAVRFDHYGGLDVLYLADVPIPEPGPGEALIQVKAASINPGEGKIREGAMHAMFPATFPSGEGSDFAGVVAGVGAGVQAIRTGEDVIGFTTSRASHAEYVVAGAENLTRKPPSVSWPAAGSLPVAGGTAYAAVRAVNLKPGDRVAVAGAAGGVGSLAVQLARRTGAQVIGIASSRHHDWLRAHGVKPIAYGDDLANRLRTEKPDALIDTHGGGYVKLAIDLGIATDRINTIADFAAARQYGVKSDSSPAGMRADVLAELAQLIASGELEVPIAATFPLGQVRRAFVLLDEGHTRGKIVLLPGPA